MRTTVKFLFPLILCTMAFAQFPPQLKNVIVIVQENRTPDNLFHFLTPACPIPLGATGYNACIPRPVTNRCYDISPCGLSNQSGTPVPITLTGLPMVGVLDPFHHHTAFEWQCDMDPTTLQCLNDGAWQTAPNNEAYTYVLNPAVTNSDGSSGHLLDPYLNLAKEYGWANFMYQTNQGASYPAHLFLFAGTSALTDTDDANSIFVSENFGSASAAGCMTQDLTPKNRAWNKLIGPADPSVTGCFVFDNNSVQECPLYNTIGPNNIGTFCTTPSNTANTVLEPNSISWKYYSGSFAGGLWTGPNGILGICIPEMDARGFLQCTGTEWTTHMDFLNHGTGILSDITNCTLPQVSWVAPDGAWADHQGLQPAFFPYGPSWIAAIANAIGTNPTCPTGTLDAGQTFWQNTVIVVTWDDWGGFSDNQPPYLLGGLPCVFTTPPTPCPGDYQFGFRVPLLVVSAYTPRGVIDNHINDFGSILRMIEGINHLPEGMMGNADARAKSDLSAFFTVRLPPRTYVTIPAMKDANFFLTYNQPDLAPDDD